MNDRDFTLDHLRSEAVRAIQPYLEYTGWQMNTNSGDPNFGQWIHPVTLRSHDIDHAFSIQIVLEQHKGPVVEAIIHEQ